MTRLCGVGSCTKMIVVIILSCMGQSGVNCNMTRKVVHHHFQNPSLLFPYLGHLHWYETQSQHMTEKGDKAETPLFQKEAVERQKGVSTFFCSSFRFFFLLCLSTNNLKTGQTLTRRCEEFQTPFLAFISACKCERKIAGLSRRLSCQICSDQSQVQLDN